MEMGMVIFYLYTLLFITSFFAIATKTLANKCIETSPCHNSTNSLSDYYKIRFPFILKDSHSKTCGCPGFILSCTAQNKTILELPNSPIIKFVTVVHIDYGTRIILISIPNEFWVHAKLGFSNFLNLSYSPFHSYSSWASRATLLDCPSQPSRNAASMICTNDINKICAVPSKRHIEDYSNVDSCTKLYDFKAPIGFEDGLHRLTWSRHSCNLSRRKGISVKTKVISGSIVGSLLIISLFIAAIYSLPSKEDRENQLRITKFLDDYIANKPSRYAYSDIKKITKKFKDKIGQGCFGSVFKGKLSSEILVAVKILNCTSENSDEFINEVAIMCQIHHINVVRLVGYCADRMRRAIVYEFLPNGSLDKYISTTRNNKRRSVISWEKFRDIAIGIAKGIEYLHQGCGQRILHFDIKPNNILLDRNFNPKISDFGLAKLCSKDQSLVSMNTARGTMGYIAPEVFSINFGTVSYKSNVYSFGMLLLEIVGGRKNSTYVKEGGNSEIYYPEWIYNILEEGEELRIQIEEEGDLEIAKKLAIVGLWCIQWHPIGRPNMKLVVQMLEGKEELQMPPNPFAATRTSKANTSTNTVTRCSSLELETIAE